MVKSKSEKKIANVLTKYHLGYQYEPQLKMGKYTFAPDFYIPLFDIYIEFFGLIRFKKYRKKTIWKRKMYRKHGHKLISLYPRHIYQKTDLEIMLYLNNAFKTLSEIKIE